MSLAPNYTPTTSFATDETNQVAGRSTVKTVSVDTELANISASINALNTNIKLLQRDDGKVKDMLIEPYMLSEQARALVSTGGVPRGDWVAATAYAVKDVVQHTGFAYLCHTAHTSSGAFDATKFIGISGDGSAAASAAAASASQTAAAASATSAATSATTATTQAGNASTSATAASGSAATANNSQLAAATSETNAASSAAAAQAAVVGNIGAAIHLATNKVTPVDADELGMWDSVTGLLNRLKLYNLKYWLKGVTAGQFVTADQAVTAWARAATTVLGTSLNGTLSDTSVAITAFNGVAGVTYQCRALGAGTLTYSATDLIITQTGASITTEAGDTFEVEMLTATTCRVKNYQCANGRVLTGQMKFPATQNPSADANTFDDYKEANYTPTIIATTGTLTTVSATAAYTKKGREVTLHYHIVITTNGTGATALRMTTPHTPAESFCGVAREVVSTGKLLSAHGYATVASVDLVGYDNTYVGGNGYTYNGTVTYIV